jgi:rubrerythrin
MRDFASLSEREILALAIGLEEEDERIYADLSEGLRQDFPASATVFDGMRVEESNHRHRLTDLYREKFGDHIPLIRRQDVRGFAQRRPIWLAQPLRIEQVRKQAAAMEEETRRFYEKAAAISEDINVRQLLNDLAHEEREHQAKAHALESAELKSGDRMTEEQTQKRQFLLQIVQPGLVGLMDGSVSTLAPVFAAALATRSTWAAFLVGLAASFGAGISMGFAEALSDDGTLTGRGHPLVRGFITGAMTALGGLGHTLPFLIGDFTVAFSVAAIVVLIELGVITWARHRYMEAPLLASALQVALGGAIVFAAGVLIGSF